MRGGLHYQLQAQGDFRRTATEVSVTIIETPGTRSADGLRRSAGGWKGLIDADALIENIYNDRMVSTRPVLRL